jgi:hypothetical protein
MAKRPAPGSWSRAGAWCPANAHVWERGPQVMLHLPTEAGTRELLVRVCTQCTLVQALHVVHLGGNGRLEAWEHWWIEAERTLSVWQQTHVLSDKGQEAARSIR